MNISKPTDKKAPEPLSILLIGPPGGGKTSLAMQFPYPCFMDCDRNLDGPERFIRSKNSNLEYGYVQITYKDGKPLPVHECYDRLLTELDAIAKVPECKTVVVDGVTLINQFIIQKVQHVQKRDTMELRDWGKVGAAFINLLYVRLRQTGKNTIVTCHENPVERANPTNPMLKELVKLEPAINGGIAHTMAGLFTDVWRCYSEPVAGGKVRFVIRTSKDTYSADLKNSLGLPSEIQINSGELAFDKLKLFMQAYL